MLPSTIVSRLALASLIVILGGCQSRVIHEPVPIGYVSESLGFPVVNRNNRQYILARQSRIYTSDIFDTDATSMVEVTFLDESVITIARKSHLVLHQYLSDSDSTSMNLNLTKGTIRAVLNSRSELIIGTPLASVQLSGGGSFARFAANTLEIVMLGNGKLQVSNDDGDVAINRPNYGTTVIAGSAPRSPVLWTQSRLRKAFQVTNISNSR